jgi:hypothetical protein
MYLYVELWKPRAAWRALPADERSAFIEGIGPAIGTLTDAGIELVGFAFNDDDTEYRADYAYLALWRMPSKDLARTLETAVIDAGFHTYFEQVNARGELVAPESVLGHMLKNV